MLLWGWGGSCCDATAPAPGLAVAPLWLGPVCDSGAGDCTQLSQWSHSEPESAGAGLLLSLSLRCAEISALLAGHGSSVRKCWLLTLAPAWWLQPAWLRPCPVSCCLIPLTLSLPSIPLPLDLRTHLSLNKVRARSWVRNATWPVMLMLNKGARQDSGVSKFASYSGCKGAKYSRKVSHHLSCVVSPDGLACQLSGPGTLRHKMRYEMRFRQSRKDGLREYINSLKKERSRGRLADLIWTILLWLYFLQYQERLSFISIN